MYRIYAEFDSRTAAERAADRLRGTVNGLGRISIHPRPGEYRNPDSDRHSFAAENAAYLSNNFFMGSAFPLASALGEGRTLSHERYRDPLENREHLLSAHGPASAIPRAAQLLRSCGGRCITFTGSQD